MGPHYIVFLIRLAHLAAIRIVPAFITHCTSTPKQISQRLEYCEKHRFEPVKTFWDGVIFTDEARMSMSELPPQNILRVKGERNLPKNIVPTPSRTATDVHFAAWINYYDRQPNLIFYNDEMDDVHIEKPPPKPRRRPKTETDDEYQIRLADWEAQKAREPKFSHLGNSMTAEYYTKNILPTYVEAYQSLVSRSDELRAHLHPDRRSEWYLMEDNDPSHGTKNPFSVLSRYRENHGITTLPHPANSPDFNPIKSL